MFKSHRKFLKNLILDPLVKNSTLAILIGGLVAIAAAEYYKTGLGEHYSGLLDRLGWTVLGAGVFAVIMKSAQFSELFQQHIADVIYSPERSTDKELLPEKWRFLTNSRVKELLPLDYDKAVDGIEKRFFDDELDYHFKDLEITYIINIGEDGKVKITNTIDTFLQIPENVEDPVFKQKVIADSPVKLTKIFIDGKNISLEDKNLFKPTGKANENELILNLRDHSQGAKSIKLRRTFECTQEIKSEPYVTALISRFVMGATVRASISSTHRVRFLSMGLQAAEPQIDGDGLMMWRLAGAQDLLLPGQGYTLIFVPV